MLKRGFAVSRGDLRHTGLGPLLRCAAFAVSLGPGIASAQSTVDEGFNDAAGPRNPASLNGGIGWSGAYSADQSSIPALATSLTAPAALPTTSGAIRWTTINQSISLSRNFSFTFPPTTDVWMSSMTRVDNPPSAWDVRLGASNGPGVSNGVSGMTLHRGDGSFPFMTGLYESCESFPLVRFSAANAGVRTISVWANPATGPLGLPTSFTTCPAPALGSAHISLALDTPFDELRVDTNLANVSVPSGGAGFGRIAIVAAAARHRRGT